MPALKNWTGNPYQTRAGAEQVATGLQNPLASFKTAVNAPALMLYSNNLVVGEGTVVGDLTPCAYTGYASPLTTPIVLTDSNGNFMLSEASPTSFTAGAIGTPDVAYGWALLDGITGDLMAVENFDAPFHFAATGDQIDLAWRFYIMGHSPIIGAGS
jgi:hypothetical protein